MSETKKYKLVSSSGNNRKNHEQELQDFTQQDYEDFEGNTLNKRKHNEILTMACELENFEWWIEVMAE